MRYDLKVINNMVCETFNGKIINENTFDVINNNESCFIHKSNDKNKADIIIKLIKVFEDLSKGECIVLKEKKDNSDLLVDFGIHYFSDVSIVYGNRSDLTREIADDICVRYSKKNISLSITHFHEDHISGLIHMYNSSIV